MWFVGIVTGCYWIGVLVVWVGFDCGLFMFVCVCLVVMSYIITLCLFVLCWVVYLF